MEGEGKGREGKGREIKTPSPKWAAYGPVCCELILAVAVSIVTEYCRIALISVSATDRERDTIESFCWHVPFVSGI